MRYAIALLVCGCSGPTVSPAVDAGFAAGVVAWELRCFGDPVCDPVIEPCSSECPVGTTDVTAESALCEVSGSAAGPLVAVRAFGPGALLLAIDGAAVDPAGALQPGASVSVTRSDGEWNGFGCETIEGTAVRGPGGWHVDLGNLACSVTSRSFAGILQGRADLIGCVERF